MSKKQNQRRRVVNDEQKITCLKAVNYAKALCTKTTKIVSGVRLTPSHYKSCNNISVILEPEFKDKLVTPFIIVDGEAKVYQNKNDSYSKDDSYFIKIRPTLISPVLYQIMECIYSDLNYMDEDNSVEEKTFKDGYVYINGNKMLGGAVEYTHNGKILVRKSLIDELENLAKKDPQWTKAVLAASIFYDNNNMCKISFSLKKLVMEKVCKTTLIDANGEIISVVTSGDDADNTEADNSQEDSFPIRPPYRSKNVSFKIHEDENIDEIDQSLFSVH